MNTAKTRVVITGIGAITPIGIALDDIENALKKSISGVQSITQFDTEKLPVTFAGEASAFQAENFLDVREIRRNDRFIQMAMVASDLAVKDADIATELLKEASVVIGVGMGGLYTLEQTKLDLEFGGAKKVSPFFIPAILPNLASGQISIRHKTQGANFAIASACASGSQAIGYAYREIKAGRGDIWIAGGAEAPITPVSIAGFSALRALSRKNDTPKDASRPFDEGRDGFVLGEGSTTFIMESLDSAQKRGAKIYCEVIGFGIASDGYHISEPEPNGEGAFRAMRDAFRDANLEVSAVQYVNAHATSTPLGDKVEGIAMERIFGEHLASTFVSSTKSLTGHACGAAGAIEAGFCALMLKNGFLAPAFNLDNPSSEFKFKFPGKSELNFQAQIIMNNSFGFGGINTSMILRKWDE